MIWCAESNMDASSQLSSFNLCTQISSLQYTLVFLDTMGPGAVLAVGGVPQCPSKLLWVLFMRFSFYEICK